MTAAPLLVELFCEELPPKALNSLGIAFANLISQGLSKRDFLVGHKEVTSFASPRRLGVLVSDVLAESPDQPFTERLMPVSVGLDQNGNATTALQKKMAAKHLSHVSVSDLKREGEGKSEQLVYSRIASGQSLLVGLQSSLEEAIELLPIPKVMSYQLSDGVETVKFVRPAHGLVALHGSEVIGVGVLGLEAGRVVHGHRFQGDSEIQLTHALDYEKVLEERGGVIPSFKRRRERIESQLAAQASIRSLSLGDGGAYSELLDEVTALVEMPTVYGGNFDSEFLSVPAECLVLTMRQNQKYFPLFEESGQLSNHFLIVSNMKLEDPTNIVQGNERVIRPRLADARFFFETDKKVKLADRVSQLGSIVYHNKLGSQRDRVDRLVTLAMKIQESLPRGAAGVEWAVRAAYLAKADLVTLMVGEFPELQGVMGRYYAEADGEERSVSRAIEQHYWPRFAGDQIPTGDASVAVALADKLVTLAGLFGIGQQSSGDKDPFALRRNALGVVRILVEGEFNLSLHDLVNHAFAVFPKGALGDAHADLQSFILERLRSYLRERTFSANEVESVLSMNPVRLHEVPRRLQAVRAFSELPESESLAAANKRVANILRQAAAKGESFANVKRSELCEAAEIALFDQLSNVSKLAKPLFDKGDYEAYLKSFAVLKAPVDTFFDSIMVMTDDANARRGRLALLADLQREMNRVADIAKLAA